MKRDKKGGRERNNCAQGPFGMNFSSLQMEPPALVHAPPPPSSLPFPFGPQPLSYTSIQMPRAKGVSGLCH